MPKAARTNNIALSSNDGFRGRCIAALTSAHVTSHFSVIIAPRSISPRSRWKIRLLTQRCSISKKVSSKMISPHTPHSIRICDLSQDVIIVNSCSLASQFLRRYSQVFNNVFPICSAGTKLVNPSFYFIIFMV